MSGRKTSLDNLAHIANISHELQVLNSQLSNDDSGHISASDSGSALVSNKTGKPKKISCIECRQQKSKCDAYEKHPEPCTRCIKKGLKCDIKSDYKRTYKRARIAQIEKEFSELKKTLNSTQAAELLRRIPTLGSPAPSVSPSEFQSPVPRGPPLQQQQQQQQMPLPPDGRGISLSPYPLDPGTMPATPSVHFSVPPAPVAPTPAQDFAVPPRTIIPEYALVCEEKSLDEVVFAPDFIRSLYLEYVNNYHPILPVVDVVKGPERLYKLCPALFWVIMFVSLRRFNDGNSRVLLLTLSPIIKDILAEITISPITRYNPTEEDEPIINACSVYSVQAFLLYTFWPPITSSLSADSSWNTIGVALFQAIRIGLHSPSLLSDHTTGTKTPQQLAMAQEQAKTWIVCNIVSQSIATSFGLPAFVQFDSSSIWSSFRPGSSIEIPKTVQFMTQIAHFEDQIAKTLNSNTRDPYGLIDPSERLPLLKVLSRQLDELEMNLSVELPLDDGHRKFQLLAARVHLLTYYFMDSGRIAQFELSKGLVSLYNAAMALINHTQLRYAKNPLFIKYLPVVYILNVWQASCIIAKLTHSPLKHVIDVGSGKQSYQAAITLAAKASVLKHDIAYRSSGIMRNMWQLFRSLEEKNLISLSINIRSRMSASVFFDCLFLLRDQVGMVKLNNRTDVNNDAADGEDDMEEEGNSNDEEYNENAVVSDDERKEGHRESDHSQKSTPGSSNTSSRRRQRSLSNTVNAESKARKIIRTIPLDPQPISAPGKRSNIFKVVNTSNDSSPTVKPELNQTPPSHSSPSTHMLKQHQIQYNEQQRAQVDNLHHPPDKSNGQDSVRMAISGNSINRAIPVHRNNNSFNRINVQNIPSFSGNGHERQHDQMMMMPEMILNESPVQSSLENLEIDNIDMNSDLLWKDVDSVMNDFGFHTQ